VLAQGRDDRAGNADDPAASSGLGRPEDDLTRGSLGERGANPYRASFQIQVAAGKSGRFRPSAEGQFVAQAQAWFDSMWATVSRSHP